MKRMKLFLIVISVLALNGNLFSQTVSINSLSDNNLVIAGKILQGVPTAVNIVIATGASGTATSVVSVAANNGTYFPVTGVTSGTINNSGTTITSIVTFTPNAKGAFTDALTITFNDGTYLLNVSGTGLEYGDVNESGATTADDAVNVLETVVGKAVTGGTFNATAADVSNNSATSAFDASYILRVAAGNLTHANLPKVLAGTGLLRSAPVTISNVVLDKINIKESADHIMVPLQIFADEVFSLEGKLKFDERYLSYDGLYIDNQEIMMNMVFDSNVKDGLLSIAMASMVPLNLESDRLFLKFKKRIGGELMKGSMTLESFLVNEAPSDISGVNFDRDEILPYEFYLEQNYPNPFNGGTNIKFGLPEASDVTLTIYTVLGQEVRTLINENRSAGSYIAQWDTKNNNGVSVATGIYLYALKAGGQTKVARMIYIK